MPNGASRLLPQIIPDRRLSARHGVDHPVLAEHARLGDIPLRITNFSPHGFMACGAGRLDRGERLQLRLPHVGQIEAHCVWIADDRAGFQFERVIRVNDFTRMLIAVQGSRHRAND